MNEIHHGNANRPKRFPVAVKKAMKTSMWAVAWWKMTWRAFSYLGGVCSWSLLLWPVSVFCIPHLSESFFFRAFSFEFLLWVIFNYLYVVVWFETRTMYVENDVSASWLCESYSLFGSCSDVTHLPKWKYVTSYTILLSTMEVRVSHTHLKVSLVKNIWCNICLDHRAIKMCMTSRAFALWLVLRAKTTKQPLLSRCIPRINYWTIWQVQFLFVQYQT